MTDQQACELLDIWIAELPGVRTWRVLCSQYGTATVELTDHSRRALGLTWMWTYGDTEARDDARFARARILAAEAIVRGSVT